MYSSCAFCSGNLGGDGGDSGLGVGRRFAYDGWKSRAWVICQRCSRWNLTPYDNRLDTVALLERMAVTGRAAASSDQVTLIRSGPYDVVRIGRPPRVEMATWRYGERMKARQREQLKIYVPVAIAVVGVGVAVNFAAGGGVGAMIGNLPQMIDGITTGIIGSRKVNIETPLCDNCHRPLVLKARHVQHARLTYSPHADLALLLSCPHCRRPGAQIEGPDAERALRSGMTYLNLKKKRAVKKKAAEAAAYLDRHGGPEEFVLNTARMELSIKSLAVEEALALEMAVDEQAELHELERQWREAEELAEIADNLLVHPDVAQRLEDLKRRRDG